MPLTLLHRLYSPVDMSLLSQRHVLEFLDRIRRFGVSAADRAGAERLMIVAEDGVGFQIYEAIERCKQELAPESVERNVRAEFVFDYPGVEIEKSISQRDFETAARASIETIFDTLQQTLELAGVRSDQVEIVCSTGGTSQVGLIGRRFRELFPRARFHRLSSYRAVVDGLAKRAHEGLRRIES